MYGQSEKMVRLPPFLQGCKLCFYPFSSIVSSDAEFMILADMRILIVYCAQEMYTYYLYFEA